MKISFDLDDCFLKYPEILGRMAVLLRASGHEVGILSGRTPREIQEIVDASMWDFIIGDEENYTIDGKYKLSLQDHARLWKSKMILKHRIDIHLDDQADAILLGKIGKSKVIKIV